MSTLVLLTLILLTLLCIYLWNRRHLYAAAAHFCGPFALPFIGNGFTLMCDLEDFFDKLNGILKQYEGCNDPLRLWFGPHLVIALRDPVHLEKIMTSQKFANKSDMMDIVKYYWGEGLISASGAIYRKQKKVIQPIFDLSYTESAMDLFHKHTNICMEKLNQFVGSGTFNIYEYISLFAVDLTGEVIAGQNIRSQEIGRTDFCDSLVDMYKVCVTRMSTVWQHSEILFNFASQKKRHDKVRRDFSNFTQKAIDDSRARRKSEYTQTNDKFLPAIDILTKLDEDCSDLFTNQELKDNLVTLFAATEDPLGLISSFSVLCFGMYPEYQKKAVEEIRKVIGENPREVTIQDLRDLEYLDMCVKDVLRLFPIAPFMLRKVTEDYKLDKWILPKGATVAITAHYFHMNNAFWENPKHFHPDHFLPEAVGKRHIYSYLPFSAGPRGCIGKTFANISIKTFLIHLLQRFEIEADGKVPDIALMSDISVRPKKGFNVRLKKRVWS